MISFKNNISEKAKKDLIQYDGKKKYKKNLITLFIVFAYSLSVFSVSLYFSKFTLMEAIKIEPILCLVLFVFYIIVIGRLLIIYIFSIENIRLISYINSTLIKEIRFREDDIEIVSNFDNLRIPLCSFGENAKFEIKHDNRFLVLQINSLYLVNESKKIETLIPLQDMLNKYKESIQSKKNQSKRDYDYSSKTIISFYNEFIYQIYTTYNHLGLSKFDILTLIFILIDLVTFNIGLWTYFIIRILFFIIYCLLLATIELVNKQSFFKNSEFYFTNNNFAIFNGNNCLLFGSNKEIIKVNFFKRFVSIDTIKGHFIVSNNQSQLKLLPQNIQYFNHYKFLFK